ncbi:MAG TPA: carboxypeptidase regulatory-like domain-containing protein [Holophaga sp.]|mgnify:CR=1 FL=1|jgi:TolA-binding protein|nr:carboxypeptidase regulatory-like domain-containing protein [Holophaga sp.]
MKRSLVLAAIPVICAPLVAQNTGRIQGKVTDKAGKPLANVTVTVKRLDVNWSKEVKTKANGSYMLVGLEPKEFEITATLAPLVPSQSKGRIIMGEPLIQDFVMLTTEEAQADYLKRNPNATVQISNQGEIDATASFNQALNLYNAQQFGEALPLLEKANASFVETLEKTKDEKEKEKLKETMLTPNRIFGVTLYEVGKTDEVRKAELWKKAEPLLTASLAALPDTDDKKPQRTQLALALLDLAKDKQDAAATKQYQDLVDKLLPPNPAKDYNMAVDAFNAGKNADAKTFLERAIQKDPKYAEAYYLMGMVEFGNNNLKGTKLNLMKYLELAPDGGKAPEVKAMLDDPSLKKIKLQ